jgi:hypothetical protein
MKNKKLEQLQQVVGCIFIKICGIAIILMSIAFTPLQYSNLYVRNNGHPTTGTIVGCIIFFLIVFPIGWYTLLRTNNPITRFNIFTLNPKWKNTMKYSMEERPIQLFELDSPDENELKKFNRDKKIDKILNKK